ncbi:MAG TPA: UvrD-helicase domain-containing protein [Spirochaetia bacterium]|nr:UvrD-helicase domain-containing protein [Spirochaetia bacterium]
MTGAAALPPYLAALNPEQLEAVRHEGGSLLILAGAGSGKTRVVTTKIAYLVRERGVAPESILAVTFTNKAAKEMRDRAAAIEPRCERAVIRTFHSFGAWFLRRNAQAFPGLDPRFVIYDDDDQATLLHAAMPHYARSECSRMVQAISRAKDYGLEPDSPDLSEAFADPELMRRVYATYEERLRRTGNVDFGDLIRLPARLLREDEAVALRTRQRFRVILVDEYQDSNVAQFELLRLLAGPAGPGAGGAYLCVVGDDVQSIYRFRGAEVRNILDFPSIFPGTSIVRLERNYRSFQSILDVAHQVVSRNSGRLGKELRAERAGGSRPKLALLADQDAEVEYCARVCARRIKEGGRLSDVAILYRTNAQSLSFEKEFPRRGIAYRVVGALRFYEREEVKDALAYLSLLSNPRDEVAFKRVANKPARGVGDASLEIVLEAAFAPPDPGAEDDAAPPPGDLLAASARVADSLKGRARSGLASFVALARRLVAELEAGSGSPGPAAGGAALGELVQVLVEDSGLAEYHRSQDEVAGTQKLANLDELVNAASLYAKSPEGLAEFLEAVELDRSLATAASGESEAADAVTLITMHNTKGLEFPVVVVTGLEQGLFPREDEGGEELEEQRRLFYVAITRAKDELHLTSCTFRRLHGRLFETEPSRFLSEISKDSIEPADKVAQRAAPGSPYGSRPGSSGPRPYGGGSYGGTRGRAAAAGPAEDRGPWRAGLGVYHEDYGSGYVLSVSPSPSSGPLVVVRFETGKEARFFPRFTTKLEPQRG